MEIPFRDPIWGGMPREGFGGDATVTSSGEFTALEVGAWEVTSTSPAAVMQSCVITIEP